MQAGDAKAIAVEWVHEHASKRHDFAGAFFSGSIAHRRDEEELSPASDVDIFIVLAGDSAPPKLGKFIHRDLLLEVTFIALNELVDIDRVATNYHLAHCFARDNIIADPIGHLRSLQLAISRSFDEVSSTRARCENVFEKIEHGLRNIDFDVPWHDRVIQWLFPTGVTTHVVLVAARKNPTVRLRYLAAKEVLATNDFNDQYEQLLDLLGCRNVAREQVQHHLDALTGVFDLAAKRNRSDLPFSSDITRLARPIAIDGSQQLINAGNHREAVFWIIATFARCLKILTADASAQMRQDAEGSFRSAVSNLLQIRDPTDLPKRSAAVNEFIPTLETLAEQIITAAKPLQI